ncbi:MAG: dihydropteroate synthase [Aaplasma endosymbiont of Hyalomma asiaticum]
MGESRKTLTKIVGVLNVTPDSFSDGGKFFNVDDALQHAKRLIADGADVVDVGGESTAPGSTGITQDEEWRRLEHVLPEIIYMSHGAGVKVSVNTRNAETAELAVRLGADYINDQGGLSDPNMPEVMAGSSAKIIVMHNLGIPASRDKTMSCSTEHVVDEIIEWLRNRVDTLVAKQMKRERIIVDPGIGFGKKPEHSWHIIKNIVKFRELGLPVYVGHSRKSVFSSISADVSGRDIPTALVSAFLMLKNVDYLRIHDVALAKTAAEVVKHLS